MFTECRSLTNPHGVSSAKSLCCKDRQDYFRSVLKHVFWERL